MITRISGKGFNSVEEINDYNKLMSDALLRDHRKIGDDLD